MNIVLILLIVYILGGFLFGIPMAKKSAAVWQKHWASMPLEYGMWEYVLFPVCAFKKEIGTPKETFLIHMTCGFTNRNSFRDYTIANFFLWPLRIAWNILALAFLGAADWIQTPTASKA